MSGEGGAGSSGAGGAGDRGDAWRARVRPSLRALSPYHVPPLPCRSKLDANESPFAPSPALLAALAARVAEAHLERYPDPGASGLRAAVASHLGQAPERLSFGNGSDELIGLLCQTFAAPRPADPATAEAGAAERPGAMVYAAPSFVVYRTAGLAAGLEVVEAPLGPRFEADEGALLAAIEAARPNLVFVATPNNPTGTRWPRATLERLVERHPGTIIVIDEAYAAYGGESHLDLVDRAPNCLSLRTYSKVGLAALRLGVLVGQPQVIHEVEKVRPPYNLGLLAQIGGELAIGPFRHELEAHVAEVVRERERLFAGLQGLPGCEVFASSANLLLFRVADAPGVWRALLDRGVLVRLLDRRPAAEAPGGKRSPLAGCLRVTVGTPDENRHFLATLREVLS